MEIKKLLKKYGASDQEINNFMNDLSELGDDPINELIQDEYEAVASYEKAIKMFDGHIRKKLEEIKNDELEHIRELKALIKFDEEEDDGITD